MDVMDVLGDLLIDLEKTAASSPTPPRVKEQNRMQQSYASTPSRPLPSNNNMNDLNTYYSHTNKNLSIHPHPVEPSFLYAPDKDIITGLPLVPRTASPAMIGGPMSPRPGGLNSPRPGSAMSNLSGAGGGGDAEVPTFSVNDSHQDNKFQSYHLDYKYTPPPIKGPCCVCGDGIMGAMVTALDKMWHPEHFCCVHCGVELRSPMYLEHDAKPYCKICHGKLFLPPCAGCGQNITGNYVKCMDKIWHEPCLRCERCKKQLTPATVFPKGGKPYCEDDFYDFSCHACKKKIKDDRKISVLGRHYHQLCFKCCECGIQLAPNNFKEKNGKLYCEKDYNDKFMPKCGGCNTPVVSGGIQAMGKNWHPGCFCCSAENCRKQLNPDNFYEKNGRPYCEDDYHRLFSPKCGGGGSIGGCGKPIKDQNNMIKAMGQPFHRDHFNCTECKKILTPDNFFEKNGRPYCEDDFHKLFSPKCAGCNRPIKDPNRVLNAMGKLWHPEHFTCTECGKVLPRDNFFEKNGLPYCEDDFHKLFSPKCGTGGPVGCGKPIRDQRNMTQAMSMTFHQPCFNCVECGTILTAKNYFEKGGLPYCEDDYHKLFSPRCATCNQPIRDLNTMVWAENKTYHPEHFTCSECGKQLKENDYMEKDGRFYCMDDYLNLFAPKCCACRLPIKDEYCLEALGGDWHKSCFVCKDCNCRLEDRNFYEIDGDPYCEQHFHARQCPDCVKIRREQNRYFGISITTPMGPSRWASQVSLKSIIEDETTTTTTKGGNNVNNSLLYPGGGDDRPTSAQSQYSTNSYDTAYTTDGGRISPSMRFIPIERESGSGGGGYKNGGNFENYTHVHGDACNHTHTNEGYQSQSQRSSLKRGQHVSEQKLNRGSGNMGNWSGSQNNLQYIAKNENPYNYLEPGKFPVESKHIRFSDTVNQREFHTDGKYY